MAELDQACILRGASGREGIGSSGLIVEHQALDWSTVSGASSSNCSRLTLHVHVFGWRTLSESRVAVGPVVADQVGVVNRDYDDQSPYQKRARATHSTC